MSKTTKNQNSRHSNKERTNGWTTPKSSRKRNSLIKIFVPKSQTTSTTDSVQNPGDQTSNISQISTPIGNKEIAFSQPSTQEKVPISPDNQNKKNIDFVPLRLDLNEKDQCSDLDSNRDAGITPQEIESKQSESFPNSTRNMQVVEEEEKSPEPVIEEEKEEENKEPIIVQEEKEVGIEREIERIIEKEVEQNLRKSIEAVLPKTKPEEIVKKSSAPPLQEEKVKKSSAPPIQEETVIKTLTPPIQEKTVKKSSTPVIQEETVMKTLTPSPQQELVKEKSVKNRPAELNLEMERAAALSTQLTHDDLSAERNKEKGKEKEKEKKFFAPVKKTKEEELPEGVPVPTKRRDCCGVECNLF